MNVVEKNVTKSSIVVEPKLKKTLEHTISEAENFEINLLIEGLINKKIYFEDPLFLIEAPQIANKLPEKLVQKIYQFKYQESHNGVLLIKGFKIQDENGDLLTLDTIAGPTPLNHFEDESNPRLQKINLFSILINSLLGDVFGWSTQHEGRLMNNILPLPGNEKEQLSTGSEVLLEWHIEEAFHEFRPDILSLLCMRNRDKIPTTICSVTSIELPQEIKNILFQKRFIFLSDNNFKDDNERGIKLEAVLYGDYESPYIRIDPAFMSVPKEDFDAKVALDSIVSKINARIIEIPLDSGDICFLDNQRVVHGRKPFVPKYDGTDRWLKRVITTRDLKKSRALRDNAISRVISTA